MVTLTGCVLVDAFVPRLLVAFWCLPPNQGTKDLIEESPDFDPFVTWAFSHGSGLVGLPRDRDIGGEARKRGKCGPDVCDDETDAGVCDDGGS